jgi:chaperonin GroEL
MTAKLATLGECVSARAEESATIATSTRAGCEPQAGSMEFESGYLSPHFITDPERMEVAFENAYILVHEKKIDSRQDLLPLLEQVTGTGKPLLIIAGDVGDEVLAALVVNKLRGPLQVAAVRVPGVPDRRSTLLEGVALLTGGTAITGDLQIELKDMQVSDLGQAAKITIDNHRTIVEGRARAISTPFERTPRAHRLSGE